MPPAALSPSAPWDLLARAGAARGGSRGHGAAGPWHPLAPVSFQAPVQIPRKVLCFFLVKELDIVPSGCVTKPPSACTSSCRRIRNGNIPPSVWYLVRVQLGLLLGHSASSFSRLYFFLNSLKHFILLGRTNSSCGHASSPKYSLFFPVDYQKQNTLPFAALISCFNSLFSVRASILVLSGESFKFFNKVNALNFIPWGQGLSSFVEDNEKSAFVAMANGAFNRCMTCTYANIGDLHGMHRRNRLLLLEIIHYLTLHYRYKTWILIAAHVETIGVSLRFLEIRGALCVWLAQGFSKN